MKKLFQLGLLLWLAANAPAQESSAPNPPKVLQTFDWKDLTVQHTNCQIQIVTLDGIQVLKIENTNKQAAGVSLLQIIDSSIIKKAFKFSFDIKVENLDRFSSYNLICHFPPTAPGGDVRTNYYGEQIPFGTSNWKRYELYVAQGRLGLNLEKSDLPTFLEVKIVSFHGTVYLRPIKLFESVDGSNWWTQRQAGLIGGIGGTVIGCLGALVGILGGKGRARGFVLATVKLMIALGILALLAGVTALALQQPYAVYYPLLLGGFIMTLVFSVNLPSIQRRYDELEIRRMNSMDSLRG